MLTSRTASQTAITRDAWVEIDLAAIEHNLAVVRTYLKPETQLMAVVKGDAYGHGAQELAPILNAAGVHAFGVASVDEGCHLRDAGIKAPILVLGPCPVWAIRRAIHQELSLTVSSASQIDDLISEARLAGKTTTIHIKVDTGMHRLGLAINEVEAVVKKLSGISEIHLAGLYSHLSCAGDATTTSKQNTIFQTVISQLIGSNCLPELVHLASSEAVKLFNDTHYDLVRVGLYLYGLEARAVSQSLIPAMSLRARINQLKEVNAGEAIGYGQTWTAKRPTKLASVPVGYADGVDRKLSNKMRGLLFGKVIQQVGLISMDQMLFDVTDEPQASEGDVITIIGTENGSKTPALYLADWAQTLDTITYELACRLRIRLPRIYTRHKVSGDT